MSEMFQQPGPVLRPNRDAGAEEAAKEISTTGAHTHTLHAASPCAPSSSQAAAGGQHTFNSAVAMAKKSMSRCPFGHGSVGAGPFPGYVHGKHANVCPSGCVPDPALDKYGRVDETPLEALVREALEYQELYHREKGNSEEVKAKRVEEILTEIRAAGTYTHTFDELQHGARVAWRNAPKCSNRKFWEDLNLLDYRHADTPEAMFAACLDMLEKATLSCVTTANLVAFRPQTPGSQDGPRVWNTQLIRYCGYKQKDGSVLGDKAEADFTSMVQEEFGWVPPPEEQRTRFDVLPVVLQSHPDQEPKVFTLPPQYVARVPITHPEYPQLAELGLQWYAVPAVSCLELSVGGLTYTACPFNGWYAVTEIVRNITEECRYDQCPAVAAKLGLDTRADTTMWRDQCIVAVTQAVMHSFRAAGYGMVDHHTLMKNFWGWYHKEKERRGYVPGNWKWIIPPVSPTASRCYLELNKMTEYTLKPNYWYAPAWRKYLARLKERRAAMGALTGPQAAAGPHGGGRRASAPAEQRQAAEPPRSSGGSSLASEEPARSQVFIAFASVTGTTAKYAEIVAQVLQGPLGVTLLNMEEFEPDSWAEKMAASNLVLLLTSTYGPGAAPSTANKLIAWLQKGQGTGGDAREALAGKPFAVLGFGSSSYPRFCAAADSLHSLACAAGAAPVMPVTKADALSQEEVTVWRWLRGLLASGEEQGLLRRAEAAAVAAGIPVTTDGKPKPFVKRYTLIELGDSDKVRAAQDRFRQEATVVEVRELLQGDPAGMATKQVVLDVSDIGGAGLSYLAGDELAVWGENSAEAVEAVATALGLTGGRLDSMFLLQRTAHGDGEDVDGSSDSLACAPFPLPNTYRTVLTRYTALYDRPSYEAVRALAGYAQEEARLRELAESYTAYEDWVASTAARWCDVWKEFPSLAGRVPPEVFFQLAPVIKSRHYSISSSAAQHPGRLHLTVSRLSYRLASGEQRLGFCSSFLAQCTPGARVGVKVLPTPGFRMPLDPTAPVIMVAAGTGIAPFKSFWEERLARAAAMAAQSANGAYCVAAAAPTNGATEQRLGPGVLAFGCRDSASDFTYRDTIQEVVSQGALSRVLTAFSRQPGARKQYVQDVIGENGELLGPLLRDRRCHVYVCGSSNMAQEVAVAFRRILGAADFNVLVESGRYHEDVFGMAVPDYRQAQTAAAAKGAIALLGSASPAEVSELLEKGGLSLHAVDHAGSTLLHVAVRAGNRPLAAMLLERGCPVNTLDSNGCTPLQVARLTGQAELAALLEARGGRLVSLLVSTFYPVHAAVMEGDLWAVRGAIAAGADLAATEYYGLTPLHVACAVGSGAVIKELIDAGAPLGASTRKGLLPLQLALALQRSEAAELLRAAGAPVVPKTVVTSGADGGTGSGGGAAAWDPSSTDALYAAVGMTTEELALLQGSWAYLTGSAFPAASRAKIEDFGVDFFLALFEQCPHLLDMFPFKDDTGKPIISELRAGAWCQGVRLAWLTDPALLQLRRAGAEHGCPGGAAHAVRCRRGALRGVVRAACPSPVPDAGSSLGCPGRICVAQDVCPRDVCRQVCLRGQAPPGGAAAAATAAAAAAAVTTLRRHG